MTCPAPRLVVLLCALAALAGGMGAPQAGVAREGQPARSARQVRDARGADRIYTELATPRFVLVTPLEEPRARALAARIAAFGLALESLLGAPLRSPMPTTIFALDGPDWVRFAEPRPGVSGYFMAHPFETDLLFDASTGAGESLELMLHEYTHHLVRTLGPQRLPPFFDEGLAELFGSARFGTNTLRLGLRRDHVARLRRDAWIPFERVLEVRRRDAEYLDHDRARVFYAQAWATAFYVLATDDRRRARVADYLAALGRLQDPREDERARGEAALRAAEALVGHPAAQANAAIARHVLRREPPPEVVLRLPRAPLDADSSRARRIGADEYDVRLGELLLRLGNRSTLARALFRGVPDDSPFAARARAGAALAVLQSGDARFAAALLDDPSLGEGLQPAAAVALGRGLLQLSLNGAATAEGDGAADAEAVRVQRLARAQRLFAGGLGDPGHGLAATHGYVLAMLALQRAEPGLLERALGALAAAPHSSELAVAVALLHETEGRAAEARRYWGQAARNVEGPARLRLLARMGAGAADGRDDGGDAPGAVAPRPPERKERTE